MKSRATHGAREWGRIRRRRLWPLLGLEVLPELRWLTPSLRREFLDRSGCGAIRPLGVAPDECGAVIRTLSLHDYLSFCRICYAAAYRINPTDEPRKLYHAFADGRHGGLLDLPCESAPAFAAWASSNAAAGAHPFEIVRNGIVLSVHSSRQWGYWLRLGPMQRHFVGAQIIAMAVALSRAGVPFGMENLAGHRLFAQGDDWVGVAADEIWERGRPLWPAKSGILNTNSNSVLLSELAEHPDAVSQVRWFQEPPQLAALP